MRLILDSWAKSFRNSDHSGVIPNHMYFAVVRELVAGLIVRGAKIVVADVAGRVAGWVCYEHKDSELVLHYVYVKDMYRKQGLGSILAKGGMPGLRLPGFCVFYTHKTPAAKYVLPKGARFVPEIARRKIL